MQVNKRKDRFVPIRALFSRQTGLTHKTRRARHIFLLNALESLENIWHLLRFLPVQKKNLHAQKGCYL